MKIAERWNRGVLVLGIEGDLVGEEETKRLRDIVASRIAGGERRIILDLEKVVRIDSAGIGEIVGCYVSIVRAGGQFRLLNPAKRVLEMLVTTRLEPALGGAFNDETEAVKSFGKEVSCPPPPPAAA